MALIDPDDLPRKRIIHEIGQELSLLSVNELEERVAILEAEIMRLKMARDAKHASKSAADAFFRKG